MPNVRSFFERLRDHHQYFFATLGIGAIVGFLRAFNLSEPLAMLVSGMLFIAGAFISHIIFLFDEQLQQAAHVRIPLGEAEPIRQAGSPLRRGYMLVLLPFLAVFMITSTRAPLGLGFFWGLSSVFWWDVRGYFTNQAEQTRIRATYFTEFAPQSLVPTGLVVGFLLYGLMLTAFLLTLRGTP